MKMSDKFKGWLLQDVQNSEQTEPSEKAPWWKVMCLTGVDYFSTLGYQPSIAFLAAGLLSPLATLILVLVTLFAALPTYSWVAKYSPNGQGSISMLERLLPGWNSKLLVLALLAFAGMGFIITITLSAADAAEHVVKNPILGEFVSSRMLVTMIMLTMLGALFLKGFKEVIGLAVGIVGFYLSLNAVLLSVCLFQIAQHPELIANWWSAIFEIHASPLNMLVVCALVFPRLALGLSGFETGVMVMPLVEGGPSDDESEGKLDGRIANTRKLLKTAAYIMCVLLVTSSVVTSLLIPAADMQPQGAADGRALAFLAHSYLGYWFGTAYDLATCLILWFAGSSAMAGLVNLVPRYLPRYGMAPAWARAVRPLVIFFTMICFFITWLFKAGVNEQSAAYATGVLVFLTAAAFAVTLARWSKGWKERIAFSAITLVFVYTTLANIWERPDGLQIALFFLVAILAASLVSRIMRATELRVGEVKLDELAQQFLEEALVHHAGIRLLAHKPGGSPYAVKVKEMGWKHHIPEDSILLVEVEVTDSSKFTEEVLEVRGAYKGDGDHPTLICKGPAVPNALAALALYIRDQHEKMPNVYFGWTESTPFGQALKFLFFGEGEIAFLTREVLRGIEPDRKKRPHVHVA